MPADPRKFSTLLKDCIYNVIHDTVLEVHRSEKLAHMQSAAIIAQQAKESVKETSSPGGEVHEVQTDGASITEDDRVLLRGNPFITAPEILCPTCRLPRQYTPTTGKSNKPADPSKQYCQKQPYVQRDGCDIYGKSLALEKPSKKSKAQRAAESKNKPDHSPAVDGSGSDDDNNNAKDEKGKPAATAIPSGKCPNCPRYMAFTRIAQHMDRCLGLSGRASSKNAMTKMSGSQGTPNSGSRASTPKPSGTPNPPGSGSGGTNSKKRKHEKGSDEDDEPPATEKKKKKLLITNKKASNPTLNRVKSADKRPPSSGRSQSPQTKQEEESD